MTANIAFLNGQWIPLDQASVSPLDRGFLFGDGVYEVIPAYAGHLYGLHEHIQRLMSSLASIKIANPYTPSEWEDLFKAVIDHNRGQSMHFSVYCQVTRGALPKRSLTIPSGMQPTVFIMATPFAPPSIEQLAKGMTAITSHDLRSAHTHIKSNSLLAATLMRLEAQEAGADEVIVVHDGFAIESISSNLFVVKDGVVYTPPLSPRLVGGVTRETIIQICKEHNIPCIEAPCAVSSLFSADELWLSGSTKEIVPVLTLDNICIGNSQAGSLWYRMIEWYKAHQALQLQQSTPVI